MSESLLRLPAVEKKSGYKRSTIYLKISKGEFPHPVSLGARGKAWVESEIDAWIAERIKISRPHTQAASPAITDTSSQGVS